MWHSHRNRLPLSTHSENSFDPAEWISQAEASRLRGVTRQAIAKLVTNGRLRSLEFGGRTFVNKADVITFVPMPGGRPKGALDA
jgi:excisionase family DNA binding protein